MKLTKDEQEFSDWLREYGDEVDAMLAEDAPVRKAWFGSRPIRKAQVKGHWRKDPKTGLTAWVHEYTDKRHKGMVASFARRQKVLVPLHSEVYGWSGNPDGMEPPALRSFLRELAGQAELWEERYYKARAGSDTQLAVARHNTHLREAMADVAARLRAVKVSGESDPDKYDWSAWGLKDETYLKYGGSVQMEALPEGSGVGVSWGSRYVDGNAQGWVVKGYVAAKRGGEIHSEEVEVGDEASLRKAIETARARITKAAEVKLGDRELRDSRFQAASKRQEKQLSAASAVETKKLTEKLQPIADKVKALAAEWGNVANADTPVTFHATTQSFKDASPMCADAAGLHKRGCPVHINAAYALGFLDQGKRRLAGLHVLLHEQVHATGAQGIGMYSEPTGKLWIEGLTEMITRSKFSSVTREVLGESSFAVDEFKPWAYQSYVEQLEQVFKLAAPDGDAYKFAEMLKMEKSEADWFDVTAKAIVKTQGLNDDLVWDLREVFWKSTGPSTAVVNIVAAAKDEEA